MAALFQGCNGSDDAYTPPSNAATTAPMAVAKDSQQVAANPLELKPLSGTAPAPGNAVNSAITPVVNSSAKGLNPAHGVAGHRCDIPVGTPLNSPAQPAVNAAPVNNNVVNTVAPTVTAAPAKVVTAPGMNPPHGEPNHRCDIAVGAPLKSPAAPAPIVAPAKTDSGS